MARRNAAEVATGAVVLLVAAGFLAYAVAHSGAASGGYTLHAEFGSIAGLPVGADVRLAGVKVGSVTAETINPETYLAEVSFTVERRIKLPKDTSAAVVSAGLLGGNYISVQPGGDTEMLGPGGRITATQSAVNLETLLGKFIFNMSSGSASQGKPHAGAAGTSSP